MKLIAFYHIPKTGGSSIVQYFRDAKFTIIRYDRTHCFFTKHLDLFPSFSADKRKCAPLNKNVFIEFHFWSSPRFWNVFIPQLSALRTLYNVKLLTSLRHPMQHALSFYRMWPSQLSFREWSHTYLSRGLQVRDITRSYAVCDLARCRRRRSYYHTDCCCCDPCSKSSIQTARQRLNNFDVILCSFNQTILNDLSGTLNKIPHIIPQGLKLYSINYNRTFNQHIRQKDLKVVSRCDMSIFNNSTILRHIT